MSYSPWQVKTLAYSCHYSKSPVIIKWSKESIYFNLSGSKVSVWKNYVAKKNEKRKIHENSLKSMSPQAKVPSVNQLNTILTAKSLSKVNEAKNENNQSI